MKYECRKYSELSKDVEIHFDEVRNLNFKTAEDAKAVAGICDVKSYSVYELVPDEDGCVPTFFKDNQRVFVTPDVLEWEKRTMYQCKRNDDYRKSVAERINKLPKKVMLYKDDEFNITAERNIAEFGAYRGFEINYHMTIMFKGKEVRGSWTGFVNQAGQVLKKKFAQSIYEAEHEKQYTDQSWDQWKITLANIKPEYIDKKAEILKIAVEELKKHNVNIRNAKGKLA